jgi:hypothetical protein
MNHPIGRQGAGRGSVRREPLPSQPCRTAPPRRSAPRPDRNSGPVLRALALERFIGEEAANNRGASPIPPVTIRNSI